MNNSAAVINSYITLLDQLKSLNKETQGKVISEDADVFIVNNINFFTKSFMITLCAYLESFLKDISMSIIDDANHKLSLSKIPYNLAKWSVNKKKTLIELPESEMKFEDLSINITKKDLDDFISGSPYKTENLFFKFGIKLKEDEVFRELKDKVISIVEKRNKIVHHNDNASDLSFSDIDSNIEIVKIYMRNIHLLVDAQLNR